MPENDASGESLTFRACDSSDKTNQYIETPPGLTTDLEQVSALAIARRCPDAIRANEIALFRTKPHERSPNDTMSGNEIVPVRACRQFRESVIRHMSVEAAKYGALNLAQGMPDFPAPEPLRPAACEAIAAGVNQYAITWGDKLLRQAIASKIPMASGAYGRP